MLKNPFKSKTVQPTVHDPQTAVNDDPLGISSNVAAEAAPTRSSTSIARLAEPDYKLSSVSPEGTFIPPSPPEKTSFLSRFRNTGSNNLSTTTATSKEADSGFVIPRESFDGYRRSFDIRPSMDGSGSVNDGRPSRASLDLLTATTGVPSPRRSFQAAQSMRPIRQSPSKKENQLAGVLAPPLASTSDEAEFEEVKLDDEALGTKKKHFWQRANNTSAIRKGLDDNGNELRSIPLNKNDEEVKHDVVGAQTKLSEDKPVVDTDLADSVSKKP